MTRTHLLADSPKQRTDDDRHSSGSEFSVPTFYQRAMFHVHTDASPDSRITPAQLIAACIDHGIDVVAITDHNDIRGALAVQKQAPFQVIIGEEIRTAERGEIIGLFLKENIERDLPAKTVMREIRAQGGLVYLPHPFDTTRRTAWPPGVVDPLLPEADIIEVFNARNVVPEENARAEAVAKRLGKAPCAGADVHRLIEVGRTLVFLQPFTTPTALLHSLRAATLMRVAAPWWLGMHKRWNHLWR